MKKFLMLLVLFVGLASFTTLDQTADVSQTTPQFTHVDVGIIATPVLAEKPIVVNVTHLYVTDVLQTHSAQMTAQNVNIDKAHITKGNLYNEITWLNHYDIRLYRKNGNNQLQNYTAYHTNSYRNPRDAI